jgi:predicted ATPase
MHIRKLSFQHDRFPTRDAYPFNLEIFNRSKCILFKKPVTFFIGENGTGKSTLLRAIARRCNIHIWEDVERSRYHPNKFENELHTCIDIEWEDGEVPGAFFASELFRHVSQILDEWAIADPGILNYFGSESLMEKSHGQGHMAYFRNRFRIRGLYLLDEPENALSPKMQLVVMKLLRQVTAESDVQFIISSHSPILLAYPGADIYSFDACPIMKVRYEDTDYFTVYRDFLNNRGRYLDKL